MRKRSSLFVASGGIVLLCWWLAVASSPLLPSAKEPLLFYANPDVESLFHHALKQARRQISLTVYAITDPGILKLLETKKEEGVHVSLCSDHDKKGADRTFSGLMHRKIAVIDNSLILIGSANLTTASLRLHDNLVVALFNPFLADFLQKSDRDTTYFLAGGQPAELWLLPDRNDRALERLLTLLQSAHKTIRIAMFTFTHPKLIEALAAAAERGVAVQCAVDFFTARGASAKAVNRLRSAGVTILESRGLQLLHHKWALIDDRVLIQGSANWTRAAFEANADCFMILHQLTPAQNSFLNKIWRNL